MANVGIMHLGKAGKGTSPRCGNRLAHMSTTIDAFRAWHDQCKRCAAILANIDAKSAKRPAQMACVTPETAEER